MKKKQFLAPCILICAKMSLLLLNCSLMADYDLPDQFHVCQDDDRRLFHIYAEETFYGSVVSSGYAKLDFYNIHREMAWNNIHDCLFDQTGYCVASVTVLSDYEKNAWKNENSCTTKIALFTANKEELLVNFEAEAGRNHFVFRDAETNQPLAVAIWSWIPRNSKWPPSWLCRKIQDWSVTIVDRTCLEEKKIPLVFLIWTLLKHTQKHLPGPMDLEYVKK